VGACGETVIAGSELTGRLGVRGSVRIGILDGRCVGVGADRFGCIGVAAGSDVGIFQRLVWCRGHA
jgi:hypothetical protein